MRLIISYAAVLGAVASASMVDSYLDKPLVESLTLQSRVRLGNLINHAKALEAIAYNTTGRNRVIGSPGHEATVKYIYDQLTHASLGDYYKVTLQPFFHVFVVNATGSLFVNGKNTSIDLADYSPSGKVNGTLALAQNLGCTEADYPQLITGKIALISRGTCTFALKSAIAGKMGAVGAIVFNNAPNATGTVDLYANSSQIYGTVVPTVTISGEDGASFANAIKAGNAPRASLQTYTVLNNVTTNNVLAHSKHGDQNNILQLGAHSDSVEEGPGINDNGSGVSSLIEVAKLLSSYRIHNSVRFSWWSGEEPGQLGAEYFVTTLTEAEKKKIRLYLNFDMMASPNYQFEIFDGDGSSYNITGPPGSGAAEKLFENYFDDRHLNHTPAVFDGRSDYKPFQEAGIAIGGLFAGADENKTREGVEKFGGIEGQPLDPNLHSPADTVSNLNTTAFLINTQGIAHAVATYATSFRSLGTNDTRLETKLETKLEKRKRERKVRRAPEKRKIGSMGLRRKLLPTKIKRSSRVFI